MINLTDRIRGVLENISHDRGGFDFAAIVEREDSSGRWDIVVSAPWITSTFEFLKIAAPKITEVLEDRELYGFGRIVVLDPGGGGFLQSFNELIGPVTKDRDLFNITIGGIPVRHAHVFGPQTSLVQA